MRYNDFLLSKLKARTIVYFKIYAKCTLKTAIIGGDPHFGELMETFLEEYCP